MKGKRNMKLKMMKRLTTVSMAILMASTAYGNICINVQQDAPCMISASAATAPTSGTCGTNLTWSINSSGVLRITGLGTEIRDYSIGTAPWYARRSQIKEIALPKHLKVIGEYAFYNMPNVKKVYCAVGTDTLSTYMYLPSTLKRIGNHAFARCTSLTGTGSNMLSIGTSNIGVTQDLLIDDFAFFGCKSLKKLRITGYQNHLITIGGCAFKSAAALEDVELNANVELETLAFYHCQAMKSLKIDINAAVAADAFADTVYNDYAHAINSSDECAKFEYQFEALLNRERVQRYKTPLQHVDLVSKAAKTVADEWNNPYASSSYSNHLRPNGSSALTALTEEGLYHSGNAPKGTIYSIKSEYSLRDRTSWTPQEAVDYFINDKYASSNVLNNAYTFIGTGVSKFDNSHSSTMINGRLVKYVWHTFVIQANPNEEILHNSGYTLIAR